MQKIDVTPRPFHHVSAFSLNTARHILSIAPAALLLLMASARPALAEESAGVILALSGKVEVVHEGKTLPAARMATLYSGDSIVTSDGQVQIRFADGTMLALYQNTRFAVNDYHYGKGKDDRAQFSLVNGLMHTLTGHIDKRNYLLKTRLANLGVRGTEYSVKLGNELHVSVDQGRVELANAGGKILLDAGQSALIIGADAMSKPITGGRIPLPMGRSEKHEAGETGDGEHGGPEAGNGEHGDGGHGDIEKGSEHGAGEAGGLKLEGGDHGGGRIGGEHGGDEHGGDGIGGIKFDGAGIGGGLNGTSFGGEHHGESAPPPPPVGTQLISDEPFHDEIEEHGGTHDPD